jgi:hypothetical protein
MTKNMTRKGLAFGAGFALVASGLGVAPASAAGLIDKTFVTLAPLTGTEYTVLADQFFDLKASFADTLAGVGTRDLKFLVEDSSLGADFRYDIDINGSNADVNTNILPSGGVALTGTGTTVTFTSATHGLTTGDVVTFSAGVTGLGGAVVAAEVAAGNKVVTVTTTNEFTIPVTGTTSGTPGYDGTFSLAATAVSAVGVTGNVATATVGATATRFNVGETVTITGVTAIASNSSGVFGDLNGVKTVLTASGTTITYAAPTIGGTATTTLSGALATLDDPTSDAVLSSRNLLLATNLGNDRLTGTTAVLTLDTVNDNYVIDSTLNGVGDQANLRLVSTGTSTTSVDVTAWMDSNGNGKIDDVEYTSPTRTVNFKKASELVVSTAMTPIVGDKNLTATVTTTPVVNGQQVIAQDLDFLNVKFTRQGSVTEVFGRNDATSNGTGSSTSVWNDTLKTFTVDVNLDVPQSASSTSAATTATTAAGTTASTYDGLLAPAAESTTAIAVSKSGVVTVTDAGHQLATGDKITMVIASADTTIAIAGETTARTISILTADVFTYTITETVLPTADIAAVTSLGGDSAYTVATFGDAPRYKNGRVFAGNYTARAAIQGAAQGNSVVASTAATSSSTVTASTVGSATVQAQSFTDTSGNDVAIKSGEKTVAVSFAVTDADNAAVSAGRPVVVTIAASGTRDTFTVNAKSTRDTLFTDANGKVTATITASRALDGAILNVTALAEGVATAAVDLKWANQVYTLVDLATTGGSFTADGGAGIDITRSIPELGSYTFNFAVMDQWFTAAAADVYRLKVNGEGVTSAFIPITSGRASVTITDRGVDGADLDTDVTLQKLSGATVTSAVIYDVQTFLVKTSKVTAAANGSTLFSTTAADLSSDVAKKALVELDKRTETTSVPVYGTTNFVRLSGQVASAATSVGVQGAVVTVSGPSNVLFVDSASMNVYKRGSLTFTSNAASGADAGKWEILAYSTTAQTDSVITITSNGVSTTAKVSFVGAGIGEGTSLVVTMPAAVKSASTFQVKAKLADVFGNGVDTVANRIKVTYTGAGIVFGALPNETDANGELSFSVLLGSNDTGSVNVTVAYDQNGDGDYVDVKDLVTTSVTAITASGELASDTKVNVGTFSGKLVVYALNAAGSEVSYKIAGKWVTQVVTSDLLQRYDRVVGATGATIKVDIYVDGVLKLAKSVVTK